MKHLNSKLIYTFTTLVVSTFIVGCKAQPEGLINSPSTPSNTIKLLEQVELSHICNDHEKIILIQDNDLLLIDPICKQASTIYQIPIEEIPNQVTLDTFLLSPDKQVIVWFVANKGIYKKDLYSDQPAKIIYSPTEWFLTNPYMLFDHQHPWLYLVDNNGSSFIRIEIETGKTNSLNIPFPFGTIFRVSPNGNSIIFVSGYRQDENYPSYLLTNNDLENPVVFTSNSEIADRAMIEWLPDSSGIISKNSPQRLEIYPINDLEKPRIIESSFTSGRIQKFQVSANKLYILDDEAWYIVDPINDKLLNRIPLEIVKEVRVHEMKPVDTNHFLVIEVLSSYLDTYYKRLWITDYFGNKHILIPKFDQILIEKDF